jgi:hypothetical protein
MTVIIKCNEIAPPAASGSLIAEAPRRNVYPRVGERAFVWTCETDGGDGLVASGVITAVGPGNRGSTRLTIDPDGRRIVTPLGKRDLMPHRDAPAGPPIASLAEKLYRHSLTKIASLDADEERFLDGRFESTTANAQ